VVAVEEQRQSLSKRLSGLTLTILAPSSIARTASGSSTQSKGKRKATEEDLSASQYVLFLQLSSLADFLWRSRFPSCDSCTVTGVLCLTELWKNRMQRISCNQCWQQKMACHWDLMGVTSPRDPNVLKQACRPIKKPVIDVDDLEDVGDSSLPSPVADIASLFFVLWNAANTLVMELAAIQATFIQFQDTLTGSLDRLTEFLVKEQAEAQENRHVALDLLQ
jgi:hypothetical protein